MKPKETIFVAGTGRSGTTWLSNLINYDNSYQFLFEPFNTRKVPALGRFRYRQYIPEDNKDEDRIKLVGDILSGKVRNSWIDKFNCNNESEKILIKSIRANLLLKWLKVNFPQVKMVLLLRYPGAVAWSKMQLGWEIHLDEFLDQLHAICDMYRPFLSKTTKKHLYSMVEEAETDFDKHILFWCMENYVPLKQFEKKDLYTIKYEELCKYPAATIYDLFSFLNKKIDKNVLNAINKPSPVSRKDSLICSGKNPLEYNEEIKRNHKRTVEILNWLGLGYLYEDEI